jgi:hypothetical protein
MDKMACRRSVQAAYGPDGGIGRRTGLKIPRPLKACRFDPDSGHQRLAQTVWSRRM